MAVLFPLSLLFSWCDQRSKRVCEDDNENKQLTLCMRRANPFVTKRCRISIVRQLDRTLGRRRAHSKFGGSKCFNLISNFNTKELSTPDFVSHVFSLKMRAAFFFFQKRKALVQTDATFLDIKCCVCLHTLLLVVESCCAKFETDRTFSHVQTDATTPDIFGPKILGVVASVCTLLPTRT